MSHKLTQYRESSVSAVSISALFDIVRFTNPTKTALNTDLVRFFNMSKFQFLCETEIIVCFSSSTSLGALKVAWVRNNCYASNKKVNKKLSKLCDWNWCIFVKFVKFVKRNKDLKWVQTKERNLMIQVVRSAANSCQFKLEYWIWQSFLKSKMSSFPLQIK